MVVVIDPQIAGISGDMLLCSLVDIGAKKSKIITGIKKSEQFLKNSKISKIDFKKINKHGVSATSLVLNLDEHIHERKATEILNCITKSAQKIGLSKQATKFAVDSITTLIYAESKIHGVPKNSVHFHEAASIDTVVDILGTAIALDDLNFFGHQIITMPIAVGSGTVTFSHKRVNRSQSGVTTTTTEIISNGLVPPNDALVLLDGRLVLERTALKTDSIVMSGIGTTSPVPLKYTVSILETLNQ